ncbi:MAG: hypothetical protein ACOY93_12685 [Bacillota bacterium]
MNYKALYDHALDHLRATDPDPEGRLAGWRGEVPGSRTDQDLLAEYGWVVVSCGMTAHVTGKLWPGLTEAFRRWEPAAVAAHPIDVRTAALNLLKNPRKIEAILHYADDLARHPNQMARLAAMEIKEVLAYLQTLPWVGATSRYHLARNLGWDVVVRTGPVPRLAAYLLTTPEELVARTAREVGERIRTVDLVLWNWGHKVGDAHMKEMASLFRLM